MAHLKIWRTVVFSGAMLSLPLAACGGGSKADQTTTPTSPGGDNKATVDQAAADQAAADKAAADKQTADKAAADQAAADQLAADKQATDKAAADQAAADAQKAADDEAAKKKRPRGGNDRPVGRGFVLA